MDDVETDLRQRLGPELVKMLDERDGAASLVNAFKKRFSPNEAATPDQGPQRTWELLGLHCRNQGRLHEALGVFDALHCHMLAASTTARRAMVGMPLVWMSDIYFGLNMPCHGKRYLMLTLCEDAIGGRGVIDPRVTGSYFRLVWLHGVSGDSVQAYAKRVHAVAQRHRNPARFAEWILQELDQDWMSEVPSAADMTHYRCNGAYVDHLLSRLGRGDGKDLERLASYLLSCIAGFRTQVRRQSGSTDYDIVCSLEGPLVDFREEMGRVVVCEAKDWARPASFEAFAKFSRVLDSTKSRFGVLFSRAGISGRGATKYAEREQLKLYQDRGIVVVVVDEDDLREVARGKSFVSILRAKYERVRLDLRD